MQPTHVATGERYSLAIRNSDGTVRDTGLGFEVIADALDCAQDIGLTLGYEIIITDHENSRPALAVRIADQRP